MAYSKWKDSIWYTYWNRVARFPRGKQLFHIHAIADYTLEQITDNLDKCVNDAVNIYAEVTGHELVDIKESDKKELRKCMLEFTDDVSRDRELKDE